MNFDEEINQLKNLEELKNTNFVNINGLDVLETINHLSLIRLSIKSLVNELSINNSDKLKISLKLWDFYKLSKHAIILIDKDNVLKDIKWDV
jgi:hypothetical protein